MTEEDIPEKLRPWWNHEFSTGGTTGPDYKQFENAYARYLRKVLPGYKIEMNRNHYEFSAVIKKPGNGAVRDKFVYLSISDVRFFPHLWADKILVRTMKHAKDWTGGPNTYCTINGIADRVNELMGRIAA